MTIATLKNEIKDLKNALNTPLDEKLKAKLREQLSKSEKTLAEMESAKTPTAKKNATKKANVVAKKSTSVLQKIKKANKKVEPKKATPKKATATKKPSVLQQLKSKIKLTKNLSGYKKSGIDLVRDANRPALPSGRRISKDGNVYYENRLNRVDIKQPPKRYPKLEEGGMMAKGGFVVFNYTDNIHASNEVFKTKKEAKEFIENFRNRFIQQGYYRTNYGERIPTNQIDLEIIPEDFNPFKKMADGGMMADGGRLKSAIMRDRAYKSNEPHEQAYTRKTRPKNPKYNYGFFADGGETEMHRAYAMGGVLQHGLEMGDFIISHDEGKMVVMNGGSKYEVNIHSGSRTKID